jgi:hypothetical protein
LALIFPDENSAYFFENMNLSSSTTLQPEIRRGALTGALIWGKVPAVRRVISTPHDRLVNAGGLTVVAGDTLAVHVYPGRGDRRFSPAKAFSLTGTGKWRYALTITPERGLKCAPEIEKQARTALRQDHRELSLPVLGGEARNGDPRFAFGCG